MAQVMAWPLNLEEYAYNAQDVMRWMAGKTSGIYGQEGNWQVQHKSGLTVTVKAENMLGGWLSNMNKYGVGFWNGSDIDLTVDIGDGVNPRIDRVVVSWHIPNQSELPVVSIRKGTPGADPVAPELVNDGEYAEICLAEIAVAAGAIEISAQDITDTRMDETLCGIVSMGIEKFPTDGIYSQFRDWEENTKEEFDKWQTDSKNQFNNWFQNLENQLSGNVAANLQKQISENLEYAKKRPSISVGVAKASEWTTDFPSENVVSIPGMLNSESCDAIVGLNGMIATDDQKQSERKAVISPVDQAEGTVTLKAYGAKPTEDLPILAFVFVK